MVLNAETLEKYGYTFESLSKTSAKLVVCRCDICGNTFDRKKLLTKPRTPCSNKACVAAVIKLSFMDRYGVDNPNKSPEVKAAIQATCIKKYGASSPLGSAKIKEKIRKTNLDRTGFENPFLDPDVQKQIADANMEKHGVANCGGLQHVQDKIRKTNLGRYGVGHAFQSQVVKDKISATMQARYGKSNPQQVKSIRSKTSNTCLARYGTTSALTLPENRARLVGANIEKYGTAYPVTRACKKEKEIQAWLLEQGLVFKADHTLCAPKEVDLVNHDKKFGIEYCGLHWHNECSPEPRGRLYHQGKLKMCEEKGYRLITIFEDEWLERTEQCKNFIKAQLGLGLRSNGRDCTAGALDKQAARQFIGNNHIQGNSRTGLSWFGLKLNGELVGVLELGKHHRGGPDLVLTRLVFSSGHIVRGGASKLFKLAKTWAIDNGYKSVISWSDNRWSMGAVYPKLGFALDGVLPPDYSYVNTNGYKGRYSKQSQKNRRSECPSGDTEGRRMGGSGMARIWDCGKKRWRINLAS